MRIVKGSKAKDLPCDPWREAYWQEHMKCNVMLLLSTNAQKQEIDQTKKITTFLRELNNFDFFFFFPSEKKKNITRVCTFVWGSGVCLCVWRTGRSLLIDVTNPKIRVVIHYIFWPVILVLRNSQIQPWLVVSIVMDDCCILYCRLVEGWVIAKSQRMPSPIQRMG